MQAQTKLKVRISDCDQLEHVNNSEYLNYIDQAIAEQVSYDLFQQLDLRQLILDYRKPAKFADELTIQSWFLADHTSVFQIVQSGGELVAQAQLSWQPIDAWQAHLPATQPQATVPFAIKPAKYGAESIGKPFIWHRDVQFHQTRGSAASGITRIRPSALLQWVEQAIMVSAGKRGWPMARMIEANSVVYMTQHNLTIHDHVSWGEELTIMSRVHDLKKIRGTWLIEFINRATGNIVASDYATGVFVNLHGEVSPPPAGLFEACLMGEPTK